jgi:DNA-binding NtrC family response regulator
VTIRFMFFALKSEHVFANLGRNRQNQLGDPRKKGAAEILGINPSTLRSRMEKLGIKRPPNRLTQFA